MDFLSAGVVRTDSLMFTQIGEWLSDHMHRFYGAISVRTMRPEVSFQDLRDADGNSGDVEENMSLYWNPAIYKVNNPSSNEKSYLVTQTTPIQNLNFPKNACTRMNLSSSSCLMPKLKNSHSDNEKLVISSIKTSIDPI